MLYTFCECVGLVVVSLKLVKLTKCVFKTLFYYLLDGCGMGFRWRNLGRWAVITGGTDGIGKAYAEELAERGFNICLISRNVHKLDSVAAELETTYQVATKTMQVDYTHGPHIYNEIEEQLEALKGKIGVLVNNVGMSYSFSEYYHAVPDGLKVMWDIINTNVTSCTMMMHKVMPKMSTEALIINISSLTALYPMPLLTTYAASKAYVDYLSRATQYEYKNKGITIQSVLPGYVSTKMSYRRKSIEVPTAEEYVATTIKTVGREDVTYGYFAHRVRGFVHEWLRANMPERVNMAIAMHYMEQSRNNYYRKLRKLQEELAERETEESNRC